MCFVLGLKFVSVVASTIQALLSSYTFEAGIKEDVIVVECIMSFAGTIGIEIKLWVTMSWSIRRRGRISLVAVDNAMYSLSVVESAISVCSLLLQYIGHPQKVTTNNSFDSKFVNGFGIAAITCTLMNGHADIWACIIG
jgi:hypothetical protein